MPSLADLPEIIGFFSYSRDDDEAFAGALSALRDAIQRELSAQLGRSKRDFRIWQDQQAIAPGTLWEAEIRQAVAQSMFFIPLVTPRAVNSKYCGLEFNAFLERERELGRSDLVFPILYISVPGLEDEAIWRGHPVLSVIGQRQYVDWRPFRHQDIRAPAVREEIERLCSKIVAALGRRWLSPDERFRQDERTAEEAAAAQAARRSDEEARRRERDEQAAARARADEAARRRAAEDESRRRAAANASDATPSLMSVVRKADLLRLFVSFEGRVGRLKYWLGTTFCVFVALFALGLWIERAKELGNDGWIALAAILLLASAIGSLAVGIKRLHDRNKSGWWIAVFYVLPYIPATIAALLGGRVSGLPANLVRVLGASHALALLAIWIWALIELGCLRGTAGPNRYGEDPRKKA